MNELKNRYDYIGEFYQGVAIVVKDSFYGAILMGGHEIIAPSYDYISQFKDGYAQAIRKGECKILDLSGRECKQYDGKLIAIPTKYDSVRDFKNGYACVQLNGKWGAIDINCKEIYEPQFYFLSDFVGGTAKYKMEYANSWGFLNTDGFRSECCLMEPEIESDGNLIIERYELSTDTNGSVYVNMANNNPNRRVRINNKGQLLVKNGESMVALPKEFLIAKNFENGLSIVQDSTGYWGAVDVNGRIVIALQYTRIKSFSENKAFAINQNGKLCLISTNGTIIKEFATYSDGDSFKGGYAIVTAGGKHGLINSNGTEILSPLDGYIHYTKNPHEFEITSSFFGGKHGLFMVSTGLLIKPRFNNIIEIKKDCVKVEVDEIGESLIDLSGSVFVEKDDKRITFPDWCIGVKKINDNIFLGITDNGRWGLLDGSGDTLCKPTFDNIGEVDNDIIPLIKTETITVGGCRKETKEITKYGLYNINSKVSIPVEYDVCPEYSNGYYKITSKGLFGIINGMGAIVLKPEWKQIHLSNGYYIVSKIVKEDYSEIERFGLITLSGNIILETKYKAISVLREGLYKVKENYNSWSIFNDEGRLTKETYDEINLEGDYIIVSKNGLSGRLNEHAEKIIKLENGNDLILPSKFAWGYDFKNGIAKVLISGCENFIDKSFNIVIASENQTIPIDESIDYLVSKDTKGNYIFVQDDKYGIINHSGKIIIEAKYQSLSHLTDDLYIAGIIKEGDHYNTYGVIDIDDKTILTFEYSSIKPYGGKIPRSYWSWDDEYITEQVEIPEEVQHWLVHKNGYGLIDRSGNICIPPEYDDIQKFENGFFVKNNDKYGVIDSNYTIICAPKYSTIKPIGNGFWKVSIITSQTYDNKTEVFGILDSFGKERLEPVYQFIGDVDDDRVAKGRAIINNGRQLGIVDEFYNILAEPQYEHISEFKDGLATVNKLIYKQGVAGVTIIRGAIDINGHFREISELTEREVSDGKTKQISTLSNGYIVVKREDPSPIYQYCAVVDNANKVVLPYKYHSIEELDKNLYLVSFREGYDNKYGVIDKNFNEVIAPKVKDIFTIRDSLKANLPLDSNLFSSEKTFGNRMYSCKPAFEGLVWINECFSCNKEIGLATTDGKILIEPCYGKVEPFISGFAKVNKGHWYDEEDEEYPNRTTRKYREGYWGIINTLGEIVLPTIYDSINIEDDGTFSVSKGIAIPCGYDNVVRGLVKGRINKNGELIIKNEKGEYVLASKKYDWQEDYNADGYSNVYYKGNWLTINNKNQIVVSTGIEGVENQFIIPEDYEWGYNGINGFIIVEKDNKQGVINTNYNLIVNPIYDHIDILSDNSTLFVCGIIKNKSATFQSCYNWYLLNSEGETLISCHKVIQLGNSLLAVTNEDGKILIMNYEGEQTTEILLDIVYDFGISSSTPATYAWEKPKKVDGLNYAIVGLEGKYGIIDNQGKLAIYPKYSSLLIQKNDQFLANGILINAFEQKIAVKDNSVLTMPGDYDKIARLGNGLLLVSKNELFGCINQTGNVIIPLKYNTLTYQNNLLIAVCYDNTDETYKCGVIDFKENQIVPFSQQIDEIKIESGIILYKQDWHWGAFTLQGQVICEPIYDHIVYVAHNLIKVGMDGKDYESYNEYSNINWGLIDNNGNEILPLEYRAIADKVIDGVVEIRSNKRIGYVDITGRVLLEPTYKSISEFVDGYAVVSKASYYSDEDGRDRERSVYGVINSQFKEIIPCVFDSIEYEVEIGRFKTDVGYKTIDGRYVAIVDGKELFVDKKYKYCKPFGDTCAIAVRVVDGHVNYGLVDKKSNDILPPIFSRLEHIENELYKFKINDLYGLVTSKGNIILQNKYNGIGKFEDNLACVQVIVPSDDRYEQKKLYGYVDSSGNEILPPSYEFIGKRNNKYSVVMKNNLWGIFCVENHHLKIIPNAAFLEPCMDNLCKINVGGIYDKGSKKTTGGLWGYVSVDGQIVIEPTYEQAYGFSEGMAAVKLNEKWGFINSEGIFVVPCEYDEVEASFKEGKGKLVKDNDIFVFDKRGCLIDTYDKPRDDDDYYDGEYYDDTPSIYDNPYYNDDLDMDQQSIEFWNSL